MSSHLPGDLAAAYAVCRAIAKREAKNFYYGFLALPPAKRDAMCAVYAFMRRADDIADDERLSLPQRRDEMVRWLASWRGGSEVSPQDAPVFAAVRDVQRRFGVSGELLDKLVEGTTMDLQPEPPAGVRRVWCTPQSGAVAVELDQYETMEALERYCYLVASVVGLTTIRIFGYTDPAADVYAERLGLAFQLTNILRDVKEDAERGRIYLPLELLSRHGLTAADVLQASHSGRLTAPMRSLLAEVGSRAEELYQSANALIPMLAPDSRAAMRVLVRIYHLLLIRIATEEYQVFRKRISVSTGRKLLVLLKGLIGGLLARRFGARA